MQGHLGPLRRLGRAHRRERRLCAKAHPHRRRTERRGQDDLRTRRRWDRKTRFRDARDRQPRSRHRPRQSIARSGSSSSFTRASLCLPPSPSPRRWSSGRGGAARSSRGASSKRAGGVISRSWGSGEAQGPDFAICRSNCSRAWRSPARSSRTPSSSILDEPTAVLSPSGVETLFQRLRGLKASGVTIVLVLHKIREVLAVADTEQCRAEAG